MIIKRYLHDAVTKDLKNKMVFIGGPRQIGKTTIAKYIGKKEYQGWTYLNWDNRGDRKSILAGVENIGTDLVIFDEIHKYTKWKNFIKGEFDKYREEIRILVTGSAHLNVYKKGGDSLMGRYFYYRLHPFSLAEVAKIKSNLQPFKKLSFAENNKKFQSYFKRLLHYGGFPETFLARDETILRRFHNEYAERLVKDDIRDLETVRDISAMQVLVELLPGKVGSLLSINSLANDLEVTHKTVGNWVDILEKFFFHYRIYPYRAKMIRSLKKEPKLYLWDWSMLKDLSIKLENLIASHLLKMNHFLYDHQGYKTDLHFLRDREGREVDFLVTVDKKPWFMVEVKNSDQGISKNIKYFRDKLNIPFCYQVVMKEGIDYLVNQIRVISADKFLTALV
jgi:hypothetical protein